MNNVFHVLISARDPSSSKSLLIVAKKLLLNRLFKVTFFLQEPAYSFFEENLELNEFTKVYKFKKKKIEQECYFLLKNLKPDTVLTGISGPDDGIDEVLLKLAHQMQIRTYSIQSFWGHINKNLGHTAKCIFVVDKFSKAETKKLTDAKLVITGCPFYENYKNINVEETLRKVHKNDVNNKLKIGFYSQPLFKIDGYKETIKIFTKQIKNLNLQTIINYRPHPKDTNIQTKWTLCELKKSGHFVKLDNMILEESLICCHACISIFSLCAHDLQQLNVRSIKPLGIPIFLMYNAKLFKWYKNYSNLKINPMVLNEKAILIKNENEIKSSLLKANNQNERLIYWQRMKENLNSSKEPSNKIINIIKKDLLKKYNRV